MDSNRWDRIRALFDRAIALPAAARDEYLRGACANEPSLRLQVESLLAADEEASGFLGSAIGTTADDLATETRLGQRVGAYEIVRELAHGGMGAVFYGRRADEAYESAVAIKLIRGIHTADHLRRFRTERQFLAKLNHPNIARLLDGGTTPDGMPYLVMEYVDGLPIDAYCDERGLGLRDRLALFRAVCSAVDHAHRALIVHRDIKPSNVMVTPDGTPKLLDFGIAKLVDPTGTGETTTLHAMTPSYASPEQLRGEPIGVGTDIYSLGVLLYRLLTGALPFDAGTGSVAEFVRLVLERDVPRPSLRPGIASPVARALRGDLDAIVLTALRKEPERRYGTAAQLSDDLGRYLAGRPVAAHPDRWTYRASKFLRRHALPVTAAGLTLTLLVGLTTFYLLGLREERDRARRAAARANEVSTFLGSLFSYADPSAAGGRDPTAREMLDRGTDHLHTDFPDQPDIEATLLLSAADAYRALGDNARAASLAERALEMRTGLFGRDAVEVGEALNTLANAVYQEVGNDSTLVLSSRADSIYRAHAGADPIGYAEALNRLGWLAQERAQYARADSLMMRSLAIRRRELGDSAYPVAVILNDLGFIRRELGDTAGADTLLEQALVLNRRIYGGNHREVAIVLGNLGVQREAEGRLPEAEQYYREGIAVLQRLYGPGHPEEAAPQVNLGRALRRLGKLAAADSALRAALAIDRKRGPDHPFVGYDLRVLGDLVARRGDLDEAERLYREAARIYAVHYPPDDVSFGTVDEGLGEVLLKTGRAAEAVPMLTQAIEIYQTAFGPRHLRAVHTQVLLGLALTALGRFDDAEGPILQAYESLTGATRPDTTEVAFARDALDQLHAVRER